MGGGRAEGKLKKECICQGEGGYREKIASSGLQNVIKLGVPV